MWTQPDDDQFACELLLAGQTAPAGIYRDLSSGRLIHLDMSDVLPPSFDGRIACYIPIKTWAHILTSQLPHSELIGEEAARRN